MHRRRTLIEGQDTGQDQSRCFTLWVRTRGFVLRGELLQMLRDFIHYPIGLSVLVNPVLVG